MITFRTILTLILMAGTSYAADYHVGPGQAATTLAGINWSSLAAGDTVYIHYATYHEKFLVSTVGTAQNPIRVIGVPDASGNRPVIDGQSATTPASCDFLWQAVDANGIQWDGVVFVAPNSNQTVPGYIEIKNLEIKNGYRSYSFTGENGSSHAYEGFAAGIYIRVGHHVTVENCVIRDNGQAIYVWAGSAGASGTAYDATPTDLVFRGNHFYGNGNAGSYFEHQVYSESIRTTLEYNRFGAMRATAEGSHYKDRGIGLIVRYNYFETAPLGWVMDFVEPEESWASAGSDNLYKQAHVYGNTIINNGNYDPVFFHWNEDHYMSRGRALQTGGRLLFYNNTILNIANASDVATVTLFNTHYGGWECVAESGHIDLRNNIFASIPRTVGQAPSDIQFSYCNTTYLDFGVNYVQTGWAAGTSHVTGTTSLITGTGDPGFTDYANSDLSLAVGSAAISAGSSLASEATSNYLGLNLSPSLEYVAHLQTQARAAIDDLGAYDYATQGHGSYLSPVRVTGGAGVSRISGGMTVGQ